ncbi:hypothetical protein Tco_1308134 [Tanacetum coccineum]
MNKPESETKSIDDLYNNFKIVEQKVKKSVGASSGAQNLGFMTALSTSCTNDANTASPQVSTASPNVNTASPQSKFVKMIWKQWIEVATLFAKYEGKESVSTVIRWDTLPGSVEHQEASKVSSEIKTTPESMETMKMHPQRQSTTYKRGLATLEEQLITYRKNAVLFSEEVVVLKREVACKEYEINVLKNEFEKVKQEKDGIEFKIEKFDKASKDLD